LGRTAHPSGSRPLKLTLLIAPSTTPLTPSGTFWLTLSLSFAAYFGLLGLVVAFRSDYVVQDDARTFVFWMPRFADPGLFPNDLIADYFAAVSPLGFTALYRLAATLGIDPLLFNKLLPLPLGLVTTLYAFRLALRLLPVPVAAFLATLILNQSMWMKDDLVSATPRAFLYPLVLAFLFYAASRALLRSVAALALLGLFYPQHVLICAGTAVLGLLTRRHGRPALSRDPWSYRLAAGCLAVALLVGALFLARASEYGPVITAAEARALPEFLPGGRATFFVDDPWQFWVTGNRSGVLTEAFGPPVIWAGLALPLLARARSRLPLAGALSGEVGLLGRLLVASFGLYIAAHLLLFRLHLPSRYTHHSLRIALALAAGLALAILLEALLRWAAARPRADDHRRPLLAAGATTVVAAATVLYPGLLHLTGRPFPHTQYRAGREPDLYRFLARRPPDVLIASISTEANYLPAFARRSVLSGTEFGVPYHRGYFEQIRQRTADLLRAQYSPDLAAVQAFIAGYGVDLWLLDRGALSRAYLVDDQRSALLRPLAPEVFDGPNQGAVPALAALLDQCNVFNSPRVVLLSADCILAARPRGPGP
jgi:hypothetical protein